MRDLTFTLFRFTLAFIFITGREASSQETNTTKTMRPVIRGRYQAVTSMKPEATWAAERILQAGGNAFDAIVAGQAALGGAGAGGHRVGGGWGVFFFFSTN